MARIHKQEIKTAIRKAQLPDPFFANLYAVSPYAACQHGCIYCDGRAEKYHLEGDFASDITARTNLPDIFEKELQTLRIHAPIHFASGIADVYQQAEKEQLLTRRCAEAMVENHFPASVLTKSSLILRDFDLWMQVHRKSQFHLQLSLTTLDDRIRKSFEPGASPVEERLEVLQEFKKAGCPVGIFMMPLLPGITETESNLIPFLEKMQELGADYILPGFLTLRPGRQKNIYMKLIAQKYPHLRTSYEELYSNELISGSPQFHYRNRYKTKLEPLLRNHTIETPHSLFQNTMPIVFEVYLLLQHMKSLYRRREIDITRLTSASNAYTNWLKAEMKKFSRKRSITEEELDNHLLFIAQTGDLNSLTGNPKLSSFIHSVIIERKTLNYQTLSLQEE